MHPQKPKRKRRPQRHVWQRTLMILVLAVPATFAALHPAFGSSLLADAISISVLLCSAVYIVYQAIVWLIATYLGITEDDPEPAAE